MDPLGFMAADIAAWREGNRLRSRGAERAFGPEALVACTNDYLGYACGGRLPKPDLTHGGVGAGASRLVAGDRPEHRALEREVAAWVGHADALVLSSGYAANVGLISAIASRGDLVVSDELNHASIIDGCRLSGAEVRVVRHGDTGAVRRALGSRPSARRRLVVTESYFSMDGLLADLPGLSRACEEHGAALLVDEAHALGVFGPEGRGVCADVGVRADVLVGTFGKALGGQGAFVSAGEQTVLWLWNRMRPFVFSTAVSPMMCEASLARARAAARDDEGRAALWRNARHLRGALDAAGLPLVADSCGPIVAIVVGGDARALDYERRLLARGVFVRAIRPPTVREGGARLRVTVHAAMSEADVARLAGALVEAMP